jgi:hypothetical protein
MRTVRGKSEKGDPSGPASAAGALRQQRGADRPELGLDRLDPCGHVRSPALASTSSVRQRSPRTVAPTFAAFDFSECAGRTTAAISPAAPAACNASICVFASSMNVSMSSSTNP